MHGQTKTKNSRQQAGTDYGESTLIGVHTVGLAIDMEEGGGKAKLIFGQRTPMTGNSTATAKSYIATSMQVLCPRCQDHPLRGTKSKLNLYKLYYTASPGPNLLNTVFYIICALSYKPNKSDRQMLKVFFPYKGR